MAINFPNSPANGDTHVSGEKTFNYDAAKGVWNLEGNLKVALDITSTPPSSPSHGDLWMDETTGDMYTYFTDADSSQWIQVNGVGAVGAAGGSGVTTYANKTAIDAVSSPSEGDLAYDLAADQLYIRTTNVWERIAKGSDETPFVTTEPPATHSLSTSGSTTTVTMSAYDPEGFDIAYDIKYNTTNNTRPSQLSSDTTINQTTGVYTFTPSTSNFGTFKARLSASDGARVTARTVDFSLLREVTFAQSTGFFSADSTNSGTYSHTGSTSGSSAGGGISNVLDVFAYNNGFTSLYFEVELNNISSGDDPVVYMYPSHLGANVGYEGTSAVVGIKSDGSNPGGFSQGLSSLSNGDRIMFLWHSDYLWVGKNGTWGSDSGSPSGSHQNGKYAYTNMSNTGGPYLAFGQSSTGSSSYTFTIHGSGSTNYTTGHGSGGNNVTVVY